MSDNGCKWKPQFLPDFVYECAEPPLPSESYCILHLKDDSKELKQFRQKVEDRINTSDDKIDLLGCYFPKDFESNYFAGRQFDKVVNFSEAEFAQKVDFKEATFSQGVTFRLVKFAEVRFLGTGFKGGVDFSWAEFRERAFFQRGPTVRWGAMGVAAVISGEVILGNPTTFEHSHFEENVRFEYVNLSNCLFLDSKIDQVDFRNCKFGNNYAAILNHPCSRLIRRHIPSRKVRRLLYQPFLRTNVLKDELSADREIAAVKKLRDENYEAVRRLYLELKKNFEEKKDWNIAGDFHFGEMECGRKMYRWSIVEGILFNLYFRSSGYGERPFRAFICLLAFVVLIFPFLYYVSERDPLGTCIWDSVKVATFMRIGNPVEPDTVFGRFSLVLEFIIGPTLFLLFALAVRRKVKR